jgi:cell division septal protein FtsQ
MAKAKRSATKKRRPVVDRARSQSVKGMRHRATVRRFGRLTVPLIICGFLLGGIGFFVVMGYRTAVASGFFAVRSVDIRGVDRAPLEDVRRIVAANTETSGVWQADLPSLREKIEKLQFVKSAAVSMALPGGIRVNVVERVPIAVVRLTTGDVLVDNEGVILAPAVKPEPSMPFVLRGWDQTKSEKAPAENLQRLKVYKKMLEEWRDIGIADRPKEVNLTDPREPSAIILDGGRPVSVMLAKDNFGKSLKSAIDAVAGKGERVKAVNAAGVSPILEYLGN